MWVARDKDKSVWLYRNKPFRDNIKEVWESDGDCITIDYSYLSYVIDFPELKWEDEPLEVELTIKK